MLKIIELAELRIIHALTDHIGKTGCLIRELWRPSVSTTGCPPEVAALTYPRENKGVAVRNVVPVMAENHTADTVGDVIAGHRASHRLGVHPLEIGRNAIVHSRGRREQLTLCGIDGAFLLRNTV